MKKVISIIAVNIILIISTGIARAQSDTGITFDQSSNWQQVLAKAKAEHKYIFVDCYATWCGPCKWMEGNVYPLKEVGDVYNQFVCLKLQMDRTTSDNDQIKNWYSVADMMAHNYTVNAYPTFLFFDPDGKPVHKVTGSMNAKQFVQLAANAQNPEKQYYSILKDFQPNELDTAEEKGLALSFKQTDQELAAKLALDYLNRVSKTQFSNTANLNFMAQFNTDSTVQKIAKAYINHLAEDSLYTKKMIPFLRKFNQTTKDRAFEVFYHHGVKVDSIMQEKRYAYTRAEIVINKEEFTSLLTLAKQRGPEPDWVAIANSITAKYNQNFAKEIIINGKVDWYNYLAKTKQEKQYWPDLTGSKINQVLWFRWDTVKAASTLINNIAYNFIFLHSDNADQLHAVSQWMKIVVTDHPDDVDELDTYACLLYKTGQTKKAIELEKKIVQIATTQKDKNKVAYSDTTITKMKAGEKIWNEKEYQ